MQKQFIIPHQRQVIIIILFYILFYFFNKKIKNTLKNLNKYLYNLPKKKKNSIK